MTREGDKQGRTGVGRDKRGSVGGWVDRDW